MQRLLGYWDNNWKRSFFYVGKKKHAKTHLWTGQASLRNVSLSTSGEIASRQSKNPSPPPLNYKFVKPKI